MSLPTSRREPLCFADIVDYAVGGGFVIWIAVNVLVNYFAGN